MTKKTMYYVDRTNPTEFIIKEVIYSGGPSVYDTEYLTYRDRKCSNFSYGYFDNKEQAKQFMIDGFTSRVS